MPSALVDSSTRIRPFIKWAGGKSRLLPVLLPHVSEGFRRYHEPFLGGGALLLATRERGELPPFASDLNPELVNAWQVVRDRPAELHARLAEYAGEDSESFYYEVRGRRYEDPLERAAHFVYLNKTGWNGLYRVNRWGEFNVPWGARSFVPPQLESLEEFATALAGVEVEAADFRETLPRAESGDFVYLDPPYLRVSDTSKFNGYTQRRFRLEDLEELATILNALTERGVRWLLSNRDTEHIRGLFPDCENPPAHGAPLGRGAEPARRRAVEVARGGRVQPPGFRLMADRSGWERDRSRLLAAAGELGARGRGAVRLADLLLARALAAQRGLAAGPPRAASLRGALGEVALLPVPRLRGGRRAAEAALAAAEACAAHAGEEDFFRAWSESSQAGDPGRKGRGAFSTPPPLAAAMAATGLEGLDLGGGAPPAILDPSAGHGALLLAVIEAAAAQGVAAAEAAGWLHGVELDPHARELCCLTLWLRVASPEVGLEAIAGRVLAGNALTARWRRETAAAGRARRPRGARDWTWERRFAAAFERGGFDLVLANPPWESLRGPRAADHNDWEEREATRARLSSQAETGRGLPPLYSAQGRGDRNLYKGFAELLPPPAAPRRPARRSAPRCLLLRSRHAGGATALPRPPIPAALDGLREPGRPLPDRRPLQVRGARGPPRRRRYRPFPGPVHGARAGGGAARGRSPRALAGADRQARRAGGDVPRGLRPR